MSHNCVFIQIMAKMRMLVEEEVEDKEVHSGTGQGNNMAE